jgi:hypothetical protein
MIKTVSQNGKVTAIEIGQFPKKPKTTEVDALMREISEALGWKLGAIKLSGYWIIGDTTHTWSPLYGHQAGQQTRLFTKALANALHVAIVTEVPFK